MSFVSCSPIEIGQFEVSHLPTSFEPPHVPNWAWRANRDKAST